MVSEAAGQVVERQFGSFQNQQFITLRYELFAFRVSAGDLAGSRGESDQVR